MILTFTDLLEITQEELYAHMVKVLEDYEYKVIQDAGGIIALSPEKGKVHPCLVAHLDTINTHRSTAMPKKEDIVIDGKAIFLHPLSNPVLKCLGADDRVGVKTVLNIIDLGLRPHIFLSKDEEVGCQGTKKAIQNKNIENLSEASMFIQIDRGIHEGSWNEMVFYQYDHESIPEIFEELSKYYVLATGSYTDVAHIGPYLNKPIVNLSASYKNEHTRSEFISIEWFWNNLKSLTKFIEWIYTQDTSDWKYTAKYYTYTPVDTLEEYYKNYEYYRENYIKKETTDL